jgi:site-specific DNA recombinase
MIAAIYARKSTGQHVADDAKSVTRQIDNAKAFAAAQGWTVLDRFIFKDDGVSGAEPTRLIERQRMIDLATSGAFDVVVMQAQDRFSRQSGHKAFTDLEHLAKHVQVWFYSDAKRFTFGTFESNVTGLLKGEFAAEFRRAIAQKTHEAMRRRAELGYVTGGRTFGYDNVPRDGFKLRVINEAEANVVREIFTRYADGEGFKGIAHALNARKLATPRPQRGRPSGWDPGTVRAVLLRPLYRGVIVYDRTKKRDADGSRYRGRAPKKDRAQWVTRDAPHLRIVPEEITSRVDARLDERRNAYLRDKQGRLLGSPRRHGHNPSRHLLAGFIACACGATFEAVRGYYVCSGRRRKGRHVCASDQSFAVESMENVFLDALEQELLAPSFIEGVLDATFTLNPCDERDRLLDERDRLTREVENLTRAIALGHQIEALATALAERDKRLTTIKAQLAKPLSVPDRDVLRAALEARRADWREVLRGPHIAPARTVLQHLIELPIRVHNEPKPKWLAAARPEGLAVGLIQSVASPTGFEPVFWP